MHLYDLKIKYTRTILDKGVLSTMVINLSCSPDSSKVLAMMNDQQPRSN